MDKNRFFKILIILGFFSVTIIKATPIKTTNFVTGSSGMGDGLDNNPNHLNEKKHVVKISIYHPTVRECDRDPLKTADGTRINMEDLKAHRIHYVAVSRDLLEKFKFGTKLRITSTKEPKLKNVVFVVHDLMGKRHKNRIDILQHPSSKLKGCWEKEIVEKV